MLKREREKLEKHRQIYMGRFWSLNSVCDVIQPCNTEPESQDFMYSINE